MKNPSVPVHTRPLPTTCHRSSITTHIDSAANTASRQISNRSRRRRAGCGAAIDGPEAAASGRNSTLTPSEVNNSLSERGGLLEGELVLAGRRGVPNRAREEVDSV